MLYTYKETTRVLVVAPRQTDLFHTHIMKSFLDSGVAPNCNPDYAPVNYRHVQMCLSLSSVKTKLICPQIEAHYAVRYYIALTV